MIIYDPSGAQVAMGGNNEKPDAEVGNYKLASSGSYTIHTTGDPPRYSTCYHEVKLKSRRSLLM